ncbi:MAG: hypothetical protein GJ680_21280 [Alteromonadaceae bacterium]|nr:hypothetical protein [Alteromonadaceae bacterium]
MNSIDDEKSQDILDLLEGKKQEIMDTLEAELEAIDDEIDLLTKDKD